MKNYKGLSTKDQKWTSGSVPKQKGTKIKSNTGHTPRVFLNSETFLNSVKVGQKIAFNLGRTMVKCVKNDI